MIEAKTEDEVLDIVCNMKEDKQDQVLTQAIDLWEMDGCPLAAGGCGITDAEADIASQTQCTRTNNKSCLESRLSMEINVD